MNETALNSEEIKKFDITDLLKKLDTSYKGLPDIEAEKRLKQFGPNSISEKKINPVVKFLMSFWGPIPWMIEIAALLSAFIQHWEDFWIIVVLLVMNAVVGFWQEYKADNAIEMLKKNWQ